MDDTFTCSTVKHQLTMPIVALSTIPWCAVQGMPGGVGGGGPRHGDALAFLRDNEHLQSQRKMVQANPQILTPMLHELGKQNPQLLNQIVANQSVLYLCIFPRERAIPTQCHASGRLISSPEPIHRLVPTVCRIFEPRGVLTRGWCWAARMSIPALLGGLCIYGLKP